MQAALLGLQALALATPADRVVCNHDQLQAIHACYKPFFAGYNLTLDDKYWPSYWGDGNFHSTREDMLRKQGLEIQPYVCQ